MHEIVHINTKYRDDFFNSSSTNFFYKFPKKIKNVLSMRLQSIDIPNSWYNISKKKGNTRFFIVIYKREKIFDETNRIVKKYTIIKKKFEVEIQEGNWSEDNLKKYFNTYFRNKKDLEHIQFGFNHLRNSVFEKKKDAPSDFKFDLIFSGPPEFSGPITDQLGWMLGFRFARYKNIQREIVSEAQYDKWRLKYVFLSVEDFQYNRIEKHRIFLDDNTIDKDILGKIYLDQQRFYLSILEDFSKGNLKQRDYLGPVDMSRIKIKLLDERGEVVNLNHMDFSFALDFTCKG